MNSERVSIFALGRTIVQLTEKTGGLWGKREKGMKAHKLTRLYNIHLGQKEKGKEWRVKEMVKKSGFIEQPHQI